MKLPFGHKGVNGPASMGATSKGADHASRGAATILIIGVLVVFIFAFFIVAIDFAYIYSVRGELQNAADAAALAGAGVITNVVTPDLAAARTAAINVAQANLAGGKPVALLANDITFGFWDGSSFTPDETKVNAVKVTPRRTKARGNPVGLFFGASIGWATMDVVQTAIATRPPKPSSAISLCLDACGFVNAGGPLDYYFQEQKADDPLFINTTAWTEFDQDNTPAGLGGLIDEYIKGELIPPNVCGTTITTDNGIGDVMLGVLKGEFDKQKLQSGLPYWDVMIPIMNAACPPGDQSENKKPGAPVYGYATLRILAIDDKSSPKKLTGQMLKCTSCSDPGLFEVLGERPALVR